MRKLGKGAKIMLIGGISMVIVGFGLYALNVNGIFSAILLIDGTFFAVVGTPYVHAAEYERTLEREQSKRDFERAVKREYVKNNMNKFAIGANNIEEMQKKEDNITSTIKETDVESKVNVNNTKVKVLVRKKLIRTNPN